MYLIPLWFSRIYDRSVTLQTVELLSGHQCVDRNVGPHVYVY